jgi:DNA-binding response OmpR family regulator
MQLQSRPVRILLATTDPGLRESRIAVLRSFGFDTTASDSTKHAVDLVKSKHFDILILGNSLSPDECVKISAAFRTHRPSGRIVEILPASGHDCKDHPDATVVGLDGPLALRAAIHKQLSMVSG